MVAELDPVVRLDVMVEGDAVRVTDSEVLERLAEAWGQKWDGRWQFEATARLSR